MTFLEATILGLVQGVFMFVPVSSTAHLVLAQYLMISMGSDIPPPESPEMILFDLVMHVGTLVSIAIVFWPSLSTLVRATIRDCGLLARRHTQHGRIAPFLWLSLMGMITVAVTGVLGLLFKQSFALIFAAPQVMIVTFTMTAVALYLTDLLPRRRLGIKKIRVRMAVIIGLAQFLALIPGLSRSGMTIIAGLFAGLKRRWAAEYSFLVAIPTILAACALQAIEVFAGGGLGTVSLTALGVGFVVSAFVGTLALKLVLALLYRAQLKIFSIYLLAMAAFVAFGVLDGLI